MSHFQWRNWSPQSPGMQVDGFKACPFCFGIDLHFPTASLISASSGRPVGQLEADIKTFSTDPLVTQYNNPSPYKIPLDHFTLDPYDSVTGFPTYYSWRCLTCNRSFESPAFVPGSVVYDPVVPIQALEVSGFQGETLGEDRAQF